MKRVGRKFGCWFRGSCLLVVLGTAAAPAFVQETATEFHAVGDFDGDGRNDVVLVDKASGGYRIGYQLSPGDYTWADTRASGVQNVTGVSVGRLLAATRDALAVTGPEANRVNLLEASSPSAPDCRSRFSSRRWAPISWRRWTLAAWETRLCTICSWAACTTAPQRIGIPPFAIPTVLTSIC